MDLQKQFIQHWNDKGFATVPQNTLLAVSGGSDSMTMATLFLQAGIPFGIAHCNFQLRGEEADKDEALVRQWAFSHDIPFHHVRFDTTQKMEEWKKGVQETARILRYEWLEAIRAEYNYQYIATAHHANDNVETLLMNLFKGTGMAGLHGIPLRNDRIIRPLLFAPKTAIMAYIAEHSVPYRDDASNATDNYLRNEVRHHIIPVVEQIFPNGVQHLNESISRFAEAEVLYKKAVEEERRKLVEKRGQDYYIPVLKLQKREPLNTICYELFKPYGYSAQQIPQIISLLASESGHYVDSATHRVLRNRGFLIITSLQTEAADHVHIDAVPCTIDTPHGKFTFSITDKPDSIPTDANRAYIDMDVATLPLTLRKWRTGDYFYPIGMGMKKKKVSKYFKDQKIALHQKDHVWVLESNKRIVWLCGMRLDERFKLLPKTQHVLRVEVR